jgi:beta-phosphoglucomutase-like phosphatase (HAD superfamily)
MIQAVLFDFNGVIIDDEPLHLRAYTDALKDEGIALTEADYRLSFGMNDRRFVEAAYERAGIALDEATLNRVIGREAELHRALIVDDLPLFPGVVTFAKSLARHYRLGIVSMARREEIEYVLERAKLDKAFDVIVSGEDVSACKPDPECYSTGFFRLDEVRRREGFTSLSPKNVLLSKIRRPGIRSARAGRDAHARRNRTPSKPMSYARRVRKSSPPASPIGLTTRFIIFSIHTTQHDDTGKQNSRRACAPRIHRARRKRYREFVLGRGALLIAEEESRATTGKSA